tara:strand:+ start:1597 stop:4026 length:2430 start_codon:yes stop_codon:yes gene_type:complete
MHAPVVVESHPNDHIVIIGEAPGGHEAIEGRPFVGPSGSELQGALDACGIDRSECQINNVIACRPPQNKLDIFLAQIRKKDLGNPIECCRPRLMDDIEGYTKIICLGSIAAAAIRGGHSSIMGLRGACEEREMPWGKVKVAYTVHPSFVLHSPKWRPVFHRDVARAIRFFNDELTWEDPEIHIVSSVQELAKHFARFITDGLPVAYDVETDAKNPLKARLRCVAISNTHLSIVVPILSIDGKTKFFADDSVETLLKLFLEKAPVPIMGHNAGQYDRLVCEEELGIKPALKADTLLLHLLADNEMPHNLGFVSSFYTDFIEAWKANHTALNAKSDEELHIYCAKDACVTARVAGPLAQTVNNRDQWHLVEREHMLQDVGVGMQRLGMRVDSERVSYHEVMFEQALSGNKRICREMTSESFNVLSTLQVRKLLFKEWGLVPEKYNEKTGEPSTDDETLRKLITHHDLEPDRRDFVQAVRMVRRYSKLLSTYIRPLKSDMVMRDGRIHPSYNRLPATGRYSSSSPNAQNIPALLRDIFIPEEGHVFVGADMDQLELRLIAEEANAKSLIYIINDGLDPHNENMEIVYGKSIWKLDGAPEDRSKKGKGTFKRTRGITKNVFYAWQYAASVPTIHQQVVSVEDEAGTLIYAHLGHRDVRDVVNGLKKAVPEIPKWWNTIRNRYRRERYIADSIWGRRRDFRDEEKINELVNHPIQSGGASIVHEAMLSLVLGIDGWGTTPLYHPPFPSGLFGFDFEGRTGLVNQCHDSLMFEVKEDDAEEAARLLQIAMTRRRKTGAKLTYTAEADIGMSWLEV